MKGIFLLITGCFLLISGCCVLYGQTANPVNDSLINIANTLSYEGYDQLEKNNIKEAESLFFKSIETWNLIKEYEEYRAFPFFSLGSLYLFSGQYNKSIEYYKYAENILKNSRPEYTYLLATLYSNIGTLYLHLGDYNKADTYIEESIKLLEPTKKENVDSYSEAVFRKAQVFYYKGEYKNSTNVCYEYIRKNDYNVLQFKRLIADCYINLEEYTQAISILEDIMKEGQDDQGRKAETLLILSKAYLLNGDIHQADSCLKDARPLLEANKSTSDPWTIYYYDILGRLLMKKADNTENFSDQIQIFNECIYTFDKALLLNSATPGKGIPYLETKGDFITPTQVRDILINRAKTLKKMGDIYTGRENEITSMNFFDQSLNTWTASIDFLHDFRISFLEEESKLTLSESQENVYIEGFKIASELYNKTGLDNYLQKMLYISESGKSATFLASLNAVRAKNFGGLPDSLLQLENELNSQISGLKQKIFSEKNNAMPDSFLLAGFENSLFELQKSYDELIYSYERDYPDYYNFKYKGLSITTNDVVNNLKTGQVLVEYLIEEPVKNQSDGNIFALVFSSQKVGFYSLGISELFIEKLETVIEKLATKKVGETNLDDYNKYVTAAHYLYTVLIEPLGISNSTNDLIIIPDGKLAYLPFDALLTKPADTTCLNFRTLPYLVYDYNISYSYSATLHFDYFRSKNKRRSNILAFAPDYSFEDVDLNKEAYTRVMPQRAILGPLPGAREEVLRLNEIHDCNPFIGADATETNFKKLAGKYDILHLAMHTVMNDSIPMFSKLVFSSSDDTLNDGYLNTQEIYNMKLNARLAVLSACNTGTGKLRSGEGVMSMARAFLYSGCPSIIMTMWEVEDKASADIMISFYKNLFQGYSKTEALRKAKLNHIKNADPFKAHPYFWLGYIVVGDPSPLKFKNVAVVSIITFSIIFLAFLIYGRKFFLTKKTRN